MARIQKYLLAMVVTLAFSSARADEKANVTTDRSYFAAKPQVVSSSVTRIQAIPSILWPQYIETEEVVELPLNGNTIKKGARGVLQRVEGEALVVDFGRWGIQEIDPLQTNFYEEVLKLMKGETGKDFPNLTIQIGNKLMHFGVDNQPRRIHIAEVKNTKYFLLLYLGDYNEQTASHLYNFGLLYEDLKSLVPELMIAVMPLDRKYYDFGYTVSLPTPFIFPHMRQGYIKSLKHTTSGNYPALVLTDAEGALLYKSQEGFTWDEFQSEIQAAYSTIKTDTTKVFQSESRVRARSASWLSR